MSKLTLKLTAHYDDTECFHDVLEIDLSDIPEHIREDQMGREIFKFYLPFRNHRESEFIQAQRDNFRETLYGKLGQIFAQEELDQRFKDSYSPTIERTKVKKRFNAVEDD